MRLYHGTTAVLAEHIAARGLKANQGYVHLAETIGLAWAYAAWAVGLAAGAGFNRPIHDVAISIPLPLATLATDPYASFRRTVEEAFEKWPHVGAIAEVEVEDLEPAGSMACPPLPWEEIARQAPCYRSAVTIPARRIVQWRIFPVPELADPGVIAAMQEQAAGVAARHPRDAAGLLEDLTADAVGVEIPNGRRLVAAALDAMGKGLRAHASDHWVRVAGHGIDLGGDLSLVLLYSLLHDACRQRDGHDPGHGERAAALASELNGDVFKLDADRLGLLRKACAEHSDGEVSDDPTIGACWDADRLDLGRYPIFASGKVSLSPELMSTPKGKELALKMLNIRAEAPSFEEVFEAYRERLG